MSIADLAKPRLSTDGLEVALRHSQTTNKVLRTRFANEQKRCTKDTQIRSITLKSGISSRRNLIGVSGCSKRNEVVRDGQQFKFDWEETKTVVGDCRDVLKGISAESVQCCVTSPPYWGLRDYDHPDQIGAEASPDLYVAELVKIFREVSRVLRKDGTLWLNVGDGYARNGGTGNCGPNAIVGNTRKLIQKRNCKVPSVWGLKDRDLMGIPWRVAFALQADGWILRSKITWIKKTAMPESVKNRPTNATEEVFLFSRSPSYYYDVTAVREPTGANLRNYWILGPDPSTYGHPAAFPRELARRCIALGSRPGDMILDPFGGCGTTGIAAAELGRKSILVEINPVYATMRDRKPASNATAARIKTADS
jgi:site-specific DNA-methyltransferase (cytosine-N4-specific)